MEENSKPVYWSKWAIVLPAIGVLITGGAMWYQNIFGPVEEDRNNTQINQSVDGPGVNVGRDNNGSINTGKIGSNDNTRGDE